MLNACARWFLCCALLGTLAAPARADEATGRFRRLGDEFLDRWLSQRPQAATRLGVHDHDARLIPITPSWVADECAWLRDFRIRLEAVPRERLGFDQALERDVLAARVEGELLDLEVIRTWERDPNVYLDLVAGSIQSLLQRDFAPICARMRSATRRLRMVPEVLRAAEINLGRPPRVFTEVAISRAGGVLQFYREAIPALTAGCRDPLAQADLAEADTAAVRAAEAFLVFLRDDLLQRSDGAVALGPETYRRKLQYDEMETAPVESLLARGRRALEETRARMETLAEGIAPGQGVAAALDSIQRDHPDAAHLVAALERELDGIRDFVRTHDLVTMPVHEDLTVRETPSFCRGLSLASMDGPGARERAAIRGYLNVTPVEPDWDERQQRDHLGSFNPYSSRILAIREAIPGHYYQALASRAVPSRLRQAFPCGTAVEGWAHYCEQMAIEQGFGGGDPRVALAQQWLAMQRLGRLIVGISLHTAGMTEEEARRFLEERCYMAPVHAAREARRGALDPTSPVHALGEWRVLELRDEVRARLGPRFRLRDFHDALLRQGGSPLPVARAGVLRALTGHAGPATGTAP